MPVCSVVLADAFTSIPHKGNPAGIVPDAGGLSEDAMQRIAHAVGCNETVFILPSAAADRRFRYFTPGHEMPLCGHATVAAVYYLAGQGSAAGEMTLETQAGILPASFDPESRLVTMSQAAPEFRPFSGDLQALAGSMGIDAAGIRRDIPVLYGSTGTWTLLVPVVSESVLQSMRPQNALFPGILRELPRASVHPFVRTPECREYDFAARHFSSPYSGTTEDPVTGTASGVMGAYALEYFCPETRELRLVISQGAAVGRDGRVTVTAVRKGRSVSVSIAGTAVITAGITVRY